MDEEKANTNTTKKAMREALKGNWSQSLLTHGSDENKKLVKIIRESNLLDIVKDILVKMTFSMNPFPSNNF